MYIKYIFIQILYWALSCSTYAFANSYFTYKGFGISDVGNVLAISSLISVIIQPLMAKLIEKNENFTVKKFIIHSLFIIAITSIVIFSINNKLLILIFYVILVTSLLNAQTYLYTFIFEYINSGYKINFGFARGVGSVSFAMTSLFLGKVGDKIGFSFIPILAFVLSIILILLILSFNNLENKIKEYKKNDKNEKDSIIDFFKRNKHFSLVLVGIVFIMMTHSLINTFMLNITESLGKGSEEVGIGLMIAAMVELPVMYLIVYLNKKLGYVNLFKIFAISFVVKILITILSVLTNNIYLFYIAQFTQSSAYAIYLPATVYYTNDVINEDERVKGQAYMGITSIIGGILGNFLGGVIIEKSSVIAMLYFTFFIGLIGMIIILMAAKKMKLIVIDN
ncbi:MAG: MFS transporter [Streptobacillus sp.]